MAGPALERGQRAGGAVLAATCISTLVVNANTSAVSILLPSISADTGTSVDTLQWAVTGYSLVGAAVIVTSGALGDVFGRRRVFLGGLGLFVISCVLIALSQTGGGVIAGRAIQGAAGSTILACGMSLISVASSGAEKMRAVALWGAASAVGAAAGPLIGGLLVDLTGWQGLFWINAVVAVLCAVLTVKSVAESSDPDRPRDIDWFGTVLVAAILAPFILGVSEGSSWGWFSLPTLACFGITIAATYGFVRVEQRVAAPLIDLRLLRNRVLVGGTLVILIGAAALNALMYLLSIYFQDPATLNMSALDAGLATLPATVAMIAITPAVSPLAVRFGTRQLIGVGLILMTVGFAALVFVQPTWAYWYFVPPLILMALGMGFSNGPASSACTSAVEEADVGAASGISNMARYVGAAVATAAAASVYSSVSTNQAAQGKDAAEALTDGLAAASLLLTAICAAGILLALLARRTRPPQPRAVDLAADAAAGLHTLPRSPQLEKT
jgi:EmrB/QacA subfamily drug resistance transporter